MTKHYRRIACACVAMALLVTADQLVKRWAQATLPTGRIRVIPGLFYLTYVENYGAAFGILQGRKGLLSAVVSLVILAALVLLFSGKITRPILICAVTLVIAGGTGNLIDRLLWGYVVDYLDFSAIFGFPVFNLADCCVVAGTALILLYVLFIERREELKDSSAREG